MPTPRKRRSYPSEFKAVFAFALENGEVEITFASPQQARRFRRHLYAYRMVSDARNELLAASIIIRSATVIVRRKDYDSNSNRDRDRDNDCDS